MNFIGLGCGCLAAITGTTIASMFLPHDYLMLFAIVWGLLCGSVAALIFD